MLETIVVAIIPSILVGVTLFYWERRQKKRDADKSEQDALRIERDLIRLDLELATAQMSYAVAMAYKRGHTNGEMEVAIEKYNETMDKFREFERKRLITSK